MSRVRDYLFLPASISPFEVTYLSSVNRRALYFLCAHVPAMVIVAAVNGTGWEVALGLGLLICAGPLIAHRHVENPRHESVVMGVAAMLMAGLLVFLGQGPMQIEMHFYFFVLLALETVFANPAVLYASAATVGLHHVILWASVPWAVYNNDATLTTVGVHGLFVAMEVVCAVFVARQIFDNVVGLERTVAGQNEELARRAASMRQVLDHVAEGLATIDARGVLSPDRSHRFDDWFGRAPAGSTFFEAVRHADPAFARASEVAWQDVVDAVMPLELTIEQMPRRMTVGARAIEVAYRPLGTGEPPERTLLILRDVTDERAKDEADQLNAEAVQVLDRAQSDPNGFVALAQNGQDVLSLLDARGSVSFASLLRSIHTLKGNAAIYGLRGVAAACHTLEDLVTATGEWPTAEAVASLRQRWNATTRLALPVADRKRSVVELDRVTYAAVEKALASEPRTADALRRLRAACMVSARSRLEPFARQAERIADRLGKLVSVEIDDGNVRVDPDRWPEVWLALVHAVRNAVDHGIEPPTARAAVGKSPSGEVRLRTALTDGNLVIEIRDDGAGVDFAALRARAAARGIHGLSDAEIFLVGVSTAASVTSLSGRGVGMGSLVHAVRAAGGAIAVDSERGLGTLLRVTLPAGAGAAIGPATQETAVSAA